MILSTFIDRNKDIFLKTIYIFFYLGIPAALLLVMLILGFFAEGSQQFSLLANGFVHGHLYFLHPIGGIGQDPVLYHGKIYWDDGFFPSLILMPFVAFFDLFHILFYQGYMKWILVILTIYLLYLLAKKFKYTTKDAILLVFGFTLGSVYLGVNSVSSSWLFAQIISTLLLFWALYEYYGKRRWWLLGLISSFLVLTRIPAAMIIIFFGLTILLSKSTNREKLTKLFKLGVFSVVAVILIASYNVIRFGSPLNNGNQYQEISIASADARSMGLISIDHIPTNLYTILFRGPVPVLKNNISWSLKAPYLTNNPLGISIFLTSPYLLYLFTRKWSAYTKEMRLMLVAVAVSLITLLCYYGDGAQQFGYRYALDFMPELYVIFMVLYRKYNKELSLGMSTLLIGSGYFNFFLVMSYLR